MDEWKDNRIHNLFWKPMSYDFSDKEFWADFSVCIACYDTIEVAKGFQRAANLLSVAVDNLVEAMKNISWDGEKYYD